MFDLVLRSLQLNNLKINLSKINTYLSHFIFMNEQFLIKHREIIKDTSFTFTTEGYKENQFVTQFNIRLNDVEKKTLETVYFVFDSILVFCFLEFENYLKNLYQFIQNSSLRNLVDELKDLNTNKTLETVLVNLNILSGKPLKISPHCKFLSQEDVDSLEYFRLRRNTLVHRDSAERYKGSIKTFIESSGEKLNKYWENSEIDISELRFDNDDLILTTHWEVIDMLNIVRATTKKIDLEIMNTIDKEEWIRYLLWCFQKEVKRFDYTIFPKFLAKFNGFSEKKLNYKFDPEVIRVKLETYWETAHW